MLGIRRGPGYPRLANYNGLDDGGQVPFFAADNLIIARRGAPLRQLARANPRALTLLYERTLQVDLCCVRDLYGLDPAAVPSGWWLTQAGSRLTESIDAAQQWIPVADPRPFAPCQDVLVDGESMHVWAISRHWLNVLRGYDSAAVRHRAGARIAPHYSYRRDLSNCHLSGPQTDLRPWSFNLSSHCPRWHGQTWADYLAHRVARLVRRQGWRGIFYDNLFDLPPSAAVDVDHDGHADGGVLHGINVWRAGERALLAETRRLLPGRPILVNGDLLIGGLAQGREMEGFPLNPGAALSTAIDAYLYDDASGAPLSIVNADSNAHPEPSVPSAQLAVGAALLGDGYVSYDYGWLAHGSPWWFDAYDGGEGSAIRGPIDATTTLLPVVHPRRFRPGVVVLLDREAARVRRVLRRGLLVQRGVWGTIPTRHAARTAVTTAVQRAAGHGYLGWPLGPASLVPTARWAAYPLPVRLRRGRAPAAGHPLPGGVQLLRPTTVLRLLSTGHYAPDVTRLTLLAPRVRWALRTLIFSARGPAGQALWVYDGHTAAPVVLRPHWHRYVVPIDGAGRVVLGAGRVRGRVAITGVRLIGVQAFLWRRDFTRGTVIVNSTDAVQHVSLGRPYRVLAGDQNPAATTGRLTCALAIAPYRAAILLTAAPGTRCARAMSRAQRQARHHGRGGSTPVPHAAPRPSTARVAFASRVMAVGVLNLRGRPSPAAPVLEVLAPGTRLGVRGYSRHWIAVIAPDGTRGYVSRRDVRAVVAVPLAPAPDPEQQLRRAVTAALRLNLDRWPPVVYPSHAYGTPYLRDSFWTAQALGSRRFALDVLATFAAAERADGDPPTMFVHAYRLPRYHDDESAALLLIWAWRNRRLYGVTPPRPALQRALGYLLRRAQNGYLMTPAGAGGTWWDAYRFPTAGTLSYSQGLYAVALRCALLLGLGLPPHAIVDAERAYRALYSPRLGYLPVGTQLPASDASALTGEFLSLWLFQHPVLSDAAVLSTLHHLAPFGAGFEAVALPSGGFPGSPTMGIPGDYQNGASWLLYDALSLGAAGLHGLPDALPRLRARLALEFRHGVILHEYLQTNPSLPYYGAEPPFRDHFSWDTFVLVIDRVLRAHRSAL